AALVYARVAEQRGARTARQRSDLVDALIDDRSTAAIELLASRVGFPSTHPVRAAACVPSQDPQLELAAVERSARKLDRQVLTALHEGLIVAIWSPRTREHPLTVARQLFGQQASAVVAGPAESIIQAGPTVRQALAGLAARSARPNNREVLEAEVMLPERSLLGEHAAQTELIDRCYLSLSRSGTGLLETVDAMLDNDGVLEQAARALPVHVNTLRYRLDKIEEITGFDLRTSRGAFAIFTGVALGRMAELTPNTPPPL
ncbi:MAG: helix-turn-helix domain-containing protein, partial [Candidatus Nanopelagicales bacterium]